MGGTQSADTCLIRDLSREQVAAVREGMSWIVPVPLLSLLTAKQLEQMVCGMPEISVEVLKKVVRYREVDEQHQLVQWFWHTLEEFSNEERVLFMRFVSGRSRLPANTADISQRFQIMKVDRVSKLLGLPRHVCPTACWPLACWENRTVTLE